MITLTREEAQQVLDALNGGGWTVKDYAVELLRARLSAPEPEPVAGYRWEEGRTPPSVTFTAPPQREWQGLTDEELLACYSNRGNVFYRAIEAKLKEKNI